jgi:pyruvate dehydrogenase E1 component beta subunit
MSAPELDIDTSQRTEPDPGSASESTTDLTLVEAVREGLRTELARDDRVLVLGEDVGRAGGVFRATEGLQEAFGPDRVVDTPLAESGIVGAAIGLATHGLRPVAEIQFMGFVYPAFDQLVSHAARLRSRSRGRFSCPLTVRMPYGAGIAAPEHHSESAEALFAHQPGLKVVVPSTPADAKGLLASAIRDPDPVVVLEPKRLYRASRDAVPAGAHTVPIGEAQVRRQGSDVSVFTYGAMTRPAAVAAEELAAEGIDCEVVDLRTVSPLDRECIVGSFEKTGRAVVVHEGPRSGGIGAEVTATIQEAALFSQEAPIARVTGYDVPVPLHRNEDFYLPAAVRIVDAVRETVRC